MISTIQDIQDIMDILDILDILDIQVIQEDMARCTGSKLFDLGACPG